MYYSTMMYYIFIVLILSTYFSALVKAEECRPEEYKTSHPTNPLCCPMCNKGSVVRRDCKEESSTSCIPCGTGTFMDKPNGLSQCLSCRFCSAELGLMPVQECTTTSDAKCDPKDGYYCISYDSESVCDLAEKHRNCTAGQEIKVPGTSNTDTVCEDCKQGYYSLTGLKCIKHTKCPVGHIQREEGTATKDVVCSDAYRHHYAIIPSFLLIITLLAALFFREFYFIYQRRRQEKKPKQPVQCSDFESPAGPDSNRELFLKENRMESSSLCDLPGKA